MPDYKIKIENTYSKGYIELLPTITIRWKVGFCICFMWLTFSLVITK